MSEYQFSLTSIFPYKDNRIEDCVLIRKIRGQRKHVFWQYILHSVLDCFTKFQFQSKYAKRNNIKPIHWIG